MRLEQIYRQRPGLFRGDSTLCSTLYAAATVATLRALLFSNEILSFLVVIIVLYSPALTGVYLAFSPSNKIGAIVNAGSGWTKKAVE
jgi:hypothetical protein